MTAIETAHIETMTAEVKVLMVGNRQITLSVAKQLDRVPLEDMFPFGRIRIDRKHPRDVIGRSNTDGALVISEWPPTIRMGDLTEPITVCRIHARKSPEGTLSWNTYLPLYYNETRIRVASDAIEPCKIETHEIGGNEPHCPYWHTNGNAAAISDVIALREIDPSELSLLPLIVLAGLK